MLHPSTYASLVRQGRFRRIIFGTGILLVGERSMRLATGEDAHPLNWTFACLLASSAWGIISKRPRVGVAMGSLMGLAGSPAYVYAASGLASVHMAQALAKITQDKELIQIYEELRTNYDAYIESVQERQHDKEQAKHIASKGSSSES